MLLGAEDPTALIPGFSPDWSKTTEQCSWWDELKGIFGLEGWQCRLLRAKNKAWALYLQRFPPGSPGRDFNVGAAFAKAYVLATYSGLPVPQLPPATVTVGGATINLPI